MAERIWATERALPWPLTAPMSAARQAAVLAAPASTVGPMRVRTAGLLGSMDSRSMGSGGGGMTGAIRLASACGGTDLEVGMQDPGDLLGDKLLETLGGDPP